jgi:quinoprotein glucose dehydrogenase
MNTRKLFVGLYCTLGSVIVFLLILSGCNALESSAKLSKGQGSTGGIQHKSWTEYGGGNDQSKYVDFKQITKENVNQLQIAWTYSTNDNVATTKFNPVIVDNVMYVLAKNNSLVALNIATGKEIWIHANLNPRSKRGINYWESKDRKDRRLLFNVDNTLQEIDATTGKSILTFGDNGSVDLTEGYGLDPATIVNPTSTSPAHVFEDLIILGSSTGEGYFSTPGDIRAYNVITGKEEWIFHTIPREGEFGYNTFPKKAYTYIGGVNTWGEMSVDAKRGIVYCPTGSPTFDYYGADREGQGLFGNCIIALDARTGKRLWHFQMVHHDMWDYDATAAPQLITVTHNGKKVDAVAQASKQGFLYVFNRVTGEPLWPIVERPVTQSKTPGEKSWPTQPFPTVVPPYNRQVITAKDINPMYPAEKRDDLLKRLAAGRSGIFEPLSTEYETFTAPGANGGALHGNTAANPDKGIVYVSYQEAPSIYKLGKERPAGSRAALSAGDAAKIQAIYTEQCQGCHGADRTGGIGPSLVNLNNRVGYQAFEALLLAGRGRMPAFVHLSGQTLNDLYKYFSAPGGKGAGAGSRNAQTTVPAMPEGPVVASGGAPVKAQTRIRVPRGYPEGFATPADRYDQRASSTYFGLGFPDLFTPPWSGIAAYDLNTGKLKWNRALGTVEKFGKDTGYPKGSQNKGILVTSTGLVFATCVDGKIYAYDADNGNILWSYRLPREPDGLPAMYEYKGREYLVICSTSDRTDLTKTDEETFRGYTVLALPEIKK